VSTARIADVGALSHASGIELTSYRAEHVDRSIRRGLDAEGVPDVAGLVRLIRSDGAARGRFRRLVAVSVSGLFRDQAQFDLLERELVPMLLADGHRLSVWSAGCADGSELYSVAVVLERLGVLERSFLLGSDLLDDNVALARRGTYGDSTIPAEVRARMRWEQRDIVRDGAPGSGFRLVLCRNLAIYLAPEAKRALHETLAGALATGGVLLLGRSERLPDPEALGLRRVFPHAYRRMA
jgi:chemotaxis protein methyltransferase CheR